MRIKYQLRACLLFLSFFLLASCGLDAAFEPLDSPLLDVSSTGLVGFRHNAKNEMPGRAFNGYDVYYKYYGINSEGDTEYSADKTVLTSSTLNPQVLTSELARLGFFHVLDKTEGELTPLIPVESLLGSSYVYTLDFLPGKADAVVRHDSVVLKTIVRKTDRKSFFMVGSADAAANNAQSDLSASAKKAINQPGGTAQLNLALVIFAYGFDLNRINIGNIDERSRPVVTDRVKVSIQ